MRKRGAILKMVIIHIILVGFIFAVFLFATADKINARGVRQQVLERQVALLIDSAVPGMEFEVRKVNLNGVVQRVEVKNGAVLISVEGLSSIKGDPYFTPYDVGVVEEEDKFVVRIG